MRTIVSGCGLVVALALIVLINTVVINQNVRNSEVNSGLDSAMDYAMDRMTDIYATKNYQSQKGEQYLDDIMQIFTEALASRLQSDGEITVNIVYADLQNGIFSIYVKEVFEYHAMNKTGVCEKMKTYQM